MFGVECLVTLIANCICSALQAVALAYIIVVALQLVQIPEQDTSFCVLSGSTKIVFSF